MTEPATSTTATSATNASTTTTSALSATRGDGFDRLSVFAFLTAMVRLFHLISFPDWVRYDKRSYLLMFFIVCVLVRPRSVYLLMLLLAASMLRTLDWIPFSPNHIFFEFWVDAAVLAALVYHAGRAYLQRTSIHDALVRENVFNGFAPVARMSIMILYFYAVFHKLNRDYLDPEISCGTFLTRGLLERLHIFYFPYWAKLVAVWGTLVIELLIPVLFLFRPTRRWSILLGLVFHFVLAIHPHAGLYSFSSLLIGFFYLFTPPAFNDCLRMQLKQWQIRLRKRSYQVTGVLLAAGFASWWLYEFKDGGFRAAAFLFWYAWWVVVFVAYVRFVAGGNAKEEYFQQMFAVRPRLLWFFPVIVFLNGMSPYLGFKTQTSYSMFSNLRTEGKTTNHLFMPRSLLTSNWQDDLVTIHRTNLPELAEFAGGKRMIAYFELRRYVSAGGANTGAANAGGANAGGQNFFVDYQRGEKEYHLFVKNGVSNDPQLVKPYSWLVRKSLRFRPVYTDTCRCQH
jgi:uncharacterized membrane protein